MITCEEFRTGQHGIPFAWVEDLPECCGRCVYLVYEEYTVCMVEAPFYYYCAYNWPDKLTDTVPSCLDGSQARKE
jgi:hypothetical protein